MLNKPRKTLLSFFKRVGDDQSSTKPLSPSLSQVNALDSSELHTSKSQRIEVEETKDTYLERDPEICHQIRTYTVN